MGINCTNLTGKMYEINRTILKSEINLKESVQNLK